MDLIIGKKSRNTTSPSHGGKETTEKKERKKERKIDRKRKKERKKER